MDRHTNTDSSTNTETKFDMNTFKSIGQVCYSTESVYMYTFRFLIKHNCTCIRVS